YGLMLPASLEHALEEYITGLRSREPARSIVPLDQNALRRIRALRVEPAAFTDDGAERAWDLLSWLKRHDDSVDPELRELLDRAADSQQAPPDLLSKLSEWKDALLDRFLPDYRPTELKHQLDAEGLDLIGQLE